MSGEQPTKEIDGVVEARLAQAQARFGDRFDVAQWAAIRDQIKSMKDCSDRLRTVQMGNGDEPEIVFVPYRADDPVRSDK